jgi:hypothetical protein
MQYRRDDVAASVEYSAASCWRENRALGESRKPGTEAQKDGSDIPAAIQRAILAFTLPLR